MDNTVTFGSRDVCFYWRFFNWHLNSLFDVFVQIFSSRIFVCMQSYVFVTVRDPKRDVIIEFFNVEWNLKMSERGKNDEASENERFLL